MLSAVASTAAVGSYALAVALTSLLWLLPRAVSDVLYPRVARLSRGGDEDQREMVETKSLRHVSLVTIVSTVFLAVAMLLLVVPVFGEEFRPAVSLGLILLPGAAAIAISSVLAATVVGRGKPAYSLSPRSPSPADRRPVRDLDSLARGGRRRDRIDGVVPRLVRPLVSGSIVV